MAAAATQSAVTPGSDSDGFETGTSNGQQGIRTVDAVMHYYDDPGDGSPPMPVRIGADMLMGGLWDSSNTVTNERPMVAVPKTITDVRGREGDYNLDNCGFQFIKHETATACREDGYHDEEIIKTEYFRECEQILKDVTGATRAFVFDHRVRRGPSNWHKLGENNASKRGPLHRAHVDQSYFGAELAVRRDFADEADELMKKRWQIINVWRPIKTIRKDPLAVADSRSIPDADLVAARIIYPREEKESWTILPGESHRWYYLREQRPDEVLLIKCFDSDETVARRAPHSAFVDPAHEGDEPRESIEARALVFHG